MGTPGVVETFGVRLPMAIHGFGAVLMPDGGLMPYPAYVFGAV